MHLSVERLGLKRYPLDRANQALSSLLGDDGQLGATSFQALSTVRSSAKGCAPSLRVAESASVRREVACRREPVTLSKPKREMVS